MTGQIRSAILIAVTIQDISIWRLAIRYLILAGTELSKRFKKKIVELYIKREGGQRAA